MATVTRLDNILLFCSNFLIWFIASASASSFMRSGLPSDIGGGRLMCGSIFCDLVSV